MTIKRRTFLAGSIASATAGVTATRAVAQVAQMDLGAGRVTTLSDGALTIPGDMIFAGMPQAELTKILNRHQMSRDVVTPECNLTLYEQGALKLLFDAGSGPDFMPSAGQILDSLDALGLAPEEITHVAFTHAHPDHIWGVLDDFDDPLFPEAQYLMGRAEWEYWWNPETVAQIGAARQSFAVGAKRRMQAIEDRMTLFDPGTEILSGVAAVASFGHTPGHMSFEIRQGSDAVLVLGDAIGNHHVAFAQPTWRSGADQDMDQAVETRKHLFDRIMADQMRVIGFHLPMGGMGHVTRHQDGYHFEAEV